MGLPGRNAGSRRLPLYLMVAGTIFFWGASFPVTKVAMHWAGPTTVAFLRWSIASAILLGWSWKRRELSKTADLVRKKGWTALWVALTGITLFYFLENLALRYTTVINAGVLANLTSVFLVVLGVLWLKERLTRTEAAAVVVALVGAALVSQGSSHLALSATGLRGDLLMVLATMLGALYSIGGKGLVAQYSPEVVTTVIATFGTILLVPLALLEGISLALPLAAWAALILLGLGSGALANVWWMRILGQTDASRAGMILLLIPVVSTAIAIAFLGETLQPTVLLGSVLVLTGVAVVEVQKSSAAASKRAGAPPLQ
jgi:drug/metabolite transporter (DMT)-like permease